MDIFKAIYKLVERPYARWVMSSTAREDYCGLPVFCDAAAERARVIEALALIRSVDPRRFRRMCADLQAVWILPLADVAGMYQKSTRTCVVSAVYLSDPRTTIERLACLIVHEATHARLMLAGVGYHEAIRKRVEEVCIRREIAFARRLGDGAKLESLLLVELSKPGDYSDRSRDERKIRKSGEHIRQLKEAEAPQWVLRAAHWVVRRASRRHEAKYGAKVSPEPPSACS